MQETRITELKNASLKVRDNAHAPYSGFHVGAAILTTDGTLFCGCNVENAAYPLGQCAEASAIGAMVSAGITAIQAIAIASPNESFCFPCGGCRQKIAEFADDNTPVILVSRTGESTSYTVGELLPNAFRLSDVKSSNE